MLGATQSMQLALARRVIERRLGATLVALHLYGSVVVDALAPGSDLDLLATVSAPPDQATRQDLMRELLEVSAPPRSDAARRALEVTVVARDAVLPWRHPARRELQFGEWLRADIAAGRFESPTVDPDLTLLIAQARVASVALVGPDAGALFAAVSAEDVRAALAATVATWSSPADWAGDERNVVLALARIWFTAATGTFTSKAAAADWAIARLPASAAAVVTRAREAHFGDGEDGLAARDDALLAAIGAMQREIAGLLEAAGTNCRS